MAIFLVFYPRFPLFSLDDLRYNYDLCFNQYIHILNIFKKSN